MAAANAKKKVRTRRRERKNIEKGQVHISSSFNNTMVTITDTQRQRHCPGHPPVAWASAEARSLPPLPLRPPLRLPQRQPWSTA